MRTAAPKQPAGFIKLYQNADKKYDICKIDQRML